MAISVAERDEFDRLVGKHFSFLEEAGLSARATRRIGADADAGLAKRYEATDVRLDIGWSEFELSLAITLKYNKPQLQEPKRYAYFEPLVEFLGAGLEAPIVPDVRMRMNEGDLMRLMRQRRAAFETGLEPVMKRLAMKLSVHLREVRSITDEQILRYHDWIGA